MTKEERLQKYVEEQCKNCKNKDKFDCEIKIYKKDKETITKCEYYEKENK